MNIIVFSRHEGRAREFDLRSPRVLAVSFGLLTLVLGSVFAAGSVLGARWAEAQPGQQLERWAVDLVQQRQELEAARRLVQQKVDALAMRVGQMNAHVIRLDALGKRLTDMAGLKKGEFDFDSTPPVGGVDVSASTGLPASMPLLTDMLDRLSGQLSDRERQLGALENLIQTRELRRVLAVCVSGMVMSLWCNEESAESTKWPPRVPKDAVRI